MVSEFVFAERDSMSYIIDDVARILAGSTPRRKMLKLIGGALAGGLFGSVAFGQNSTTACAGKDIFSPCGSDKQCCGQFCLGEGNSEFCCSNSFRCPPTQCCGEGGGRVGICCCPPGFNFVPGASGHCTPSGNNGFCLTGPGTKCQAGG